MLLRERLGDSIPKSLSDSLSPSLSSGTLSTSTSISSQISTTTFESAITPSESSGYDSADIESLVDREKELATKVECLLLLSLYHQDSGLHFLQFSLKILILTLNVEIIRINSYP